MFLGSDLLAFTGVTYCLWICVNKGYSNTAS